MRDGLGKFFLAHQQQAQRGVRFGKIRSVGQRGLKSARGVVRTAVLRKINAQVILDVRVARFERGGGPQMVERLGGLAEAQQADREIELRLRIARRDFDRVRVKHQRAVVPAYFFIRLAEAVFRDVIVRGHLDGVQEKCFAVAPVADLDGRHAEAADERHAAGERQKFSFLRPAPRADRTRPTPRR